MSWRADGGAMGMAEAVEPQLPSHMTGNGRRFYTMR
jgi:hypothetical protein